MEIINYSAVKYTLDNKYTLVINSNKVIVNLINPIIKVKKICCDGKVSIVITNNTGVDLFNILICSKRRVLIEKLKIGETIIVTCLNSSIVIKYKILINNKKNIIFLSI